MKLLRNILTLLIAMTMLPTGSSSQQKTPVKKSETRAPFSVKANMMVLDQNNAPVDDIKAEDLKILEDGVEQSVTYFAKKDAPLNLALVIDNSGSLRSQLKRVQDTAGALVANLGVKDEAVLIRFVDSSKVEIMEEWTSDKTKMLTAIRDRLYIEGGASAVLDAVYLAAENIKAKDKSARSRRSAIVLISDCEDRDSYYNLKDLLTSLQGTDIQIFTIALTSEIGATADSYLTFGGAKKKVKAEELSKTLAFVTGGNTYILDKNISEGLPLSLQSLVVELRSQYVVGYRPGNQNLDSVRKLRVEISDGAKGEKRQGFIRQSYFVPKD